MSLLCPNQKKQCVGRTSLVLFVVPTNRPHNREKPYPAAAFLPTHPPPDVCSHGTANADCSCSEGNIAPGPPPSTHSGLLAEQLHMLKHCWGELERRGECLLSSFNMVMGGAAGRGGEGRLALPILRGNYKPKCLTRLVLALQLSGAPL